MFESFFARAAVVLAIGQVALSAQSPARMLTPGPPASRELSGGQSHSYQIALEAGEFIVVGVKRETSDPVVTVADPAGLTVIEMTAGDFSIVADVTGLYLVQVRAADKEAPTGGYTIRVEPPRQARAPDKARASADKTLSEGRSLFAQASVASTREAVGKFKVALALFREAEHRPGEADALLWTGDGFRGLDNETQSAREYLNQAVALTRTIEDRSRSAAALLSLGTSYSGPMERNKALEYYEQALSLYESLDDLRGKAATLTSMGFALHDLRDYRKALDYYDQALTLANAVNDRTQTARVHHYRAWTHQNLGDLPKALEHYALALPLSRSTANLRLELAVMNNTGIVYKELGDYRRALDTYEESLVLVRKLGQVSREAMLLNNIGNIYKAEGANEKSLEYFNLALPISRRLEMRGLEAAVLNNIGSAYSQIGEQRKALEHHEQSRDIRKAIGDRGGESSSLNHAGIAWRKLGDMARALDCLRQSLEIRRDINDSIGEADTLLNIAAVERDRGDPAESQATLEAALKIIESLRAKISDANLRAAYVARVQATYESYVDVLMQQHAQSPSAGHDRAALQAAERTRARVLLESLVEPRADIRHGVDAALLDRERSLERRLDEASQRLSRGLSGRSTGTEVSAARQALENLTDEYRQVRAEIRKSSPRYAALTQPEALTAEQIQKDVLDDDTVLLEVALGEERSWLWALTTQTITSIELPPRRALDAAARSLYAEVTARQPRRGESPADYARRVAAADRLVRDRAATVSQMLLGGVAEQLHGPWQGKRLAIVAAGALEYLPFAALPLPQVGDGPAARRAAVPLIARHEIVEAPSASVLATLRRDAAGRKPAPHAVAVLADPVFDHGDPRVTRKRVTPPADPTSWHLSRAIQRFDEIRGGGGLARLPFSREEANAIASLAGRVGTLRATDFEASRAAVLGQALEDYRIVHFATHGLIDGDRPELSGLILSLVNERGSSQDGFLRLHDIFNMRLNADLVVLSACQTALGKEIKGEGLVGLTRGFMYAGAPRVVASLWQVSDLATAELMKRFYEGMLRRHLPAAAALRAAQLDMSKDPRWRSPYFWAGFVLQGDWK